MSKLTEYYLGESADDIGRTINEIWSSSDEFLEYGHDWVQWLFPLSEPSNFNPNAPVLTPEDIALFQFDYTLKRNLYISYDRFLKFLGLDRDFNKLENFKEFIFTVPNHNWLRFSRLLKSISTLGLYSESITFYKFLISNNYGSETSRHYWTQAVK